MIKIRLFQLYLRFFSHNSGDFCVTKLCGFKNGNDELQLHYHSIVKQCGFWIITGIIAVFFTERHEIQTYLLGLHTPGRRRQGHTIASCRQWSQASVHLHFVLYCIEWNQKLADSVPLPWILLLQCYDLLINCCLQNRFAAEHQYRYQCGCFPFYMITWIAHLCHGRLIKYFTWYSIHFSFAACLFYGSLSNKVCRL